MERVSNVVTNEAERASTREARWRGVLLGLTPLLCLTLVAAAALGFAPVVRALLVSQGFFVEQDAEVVVLASGLALAAGVYGATLVRSLRRVGHSLASRRTGDGGICGAGVAGCDWCDRGAAGDPGVRDSAAAGPVGGA